MKFINSSIQCVMNKLCDTFFNMVHNFIHEKRHTWVHPYMPWMKYIDSSHFVDISHDWGQIHLQSLILKDFFIHMKCYDVTTWNFIQNFNYRNSRINGIAGHSIFLSVSKPVKLLCFALLSLLCFHVILFFFVLLLLLLLCAMERWKSSMFSLNGTCLLHGDL